MTYRVFELPDFQEFIYALGVAPEVVEDGTLRLAFQGDKDEVVVTLDATGRSVHVRWLREDLPILELVREGAVRVRLESRPRSSLAVEFETDSLSGVLKVQVEPRFTINDQLLFR